MKMNTSMIQLQTDNPSRTLQALRQALSILIARAVWMDSTEIAAEARRLFAQVVEQERAQEPEEAQ